MPVRTNAPTRPSRLYRGLGTYLRKSIATIFRIYTIYRPLKTFFAIGALLMLAGAALGIRFLWDFAHGDRGGHIQSLILAAVFLIIGFQTLLIALIADLIAVNRRLSEEVLVRMKRMEMPASERRPIPHRIPARTARRRRVLPSRNANVPTPRPSRHRRNGSGSSTKTNSRTAASNPSRSPNPISTTTCPTNPPLPPAPAAAVAAAAARGRETPSRRRRSSRGAAETRRSVLMRVESLA